MRVAELEFIDQKIETAKPIITAEKPKKKSLNFAVAPKLYYYFALTTP